VPRLNPLIRVGLPVFAAAALAAGFRAHAQPTWDWPSKAKNLKVLPEDSPPEKLRAVMTGFTRALGVRCPYCHVGKEGAPLSTFDFASDDNPKKQIARDMLNMLGDINADLKKMKLTGSRRVNMWCHTCHDGRPRPATLVEELTAAYDSTGVDTTIAAYQHLRTRYYGRSSYDFGEGSLLELGAMLAERDRYDDAIRILKLNVEMSPGSVRALVGLAEGYQESGRKVEAVQTYRKALQLDPENQRARRGLEELGQPVK